MSMPGRKGGCGPASAPRETIPMHAILATAGTDGDVFPYVGLGRLLRARGDRKSVV